MKPRAIQRAYSRGCQDLRQWTECGGHGIAVALGVTTMKTLAVRLFKLSTLSMTLTSLCLLAACGGGGFNSGHGESLAPGTSSNPQTLLDLQKLQNPQSSQYSQLESPIERDSFMNDLTEQTPTYSDEEIAKDAEDQYQKNLEKQREETKKREQKQSAQQDEQQGSVDDSQSANSDKTDHGAGYQPEKPSQPVTPAKPKKETQPAAPAPKPQPQQPAKPVEPAFPEEPQQPAQSETQKPAEATPAGGSFCNRLKVVTGKGEMDLKDLYNDDSQLAKSMPTAELESLRSEEKKNRFVCVLLPIAIRMEEVVYKQRREVIRLKAKQAQSIQLTSDEQKWLGQIKVNYNLKVDASYADLLARVDIIPLPLLLTMAALESGWGTSRAARELKNLFGMHGNPKTQPCKTGFDHACVRYFDTIGEGVAAYIELLNRGPYQQFREARAKMRAEGKPLESVALLKALAVKYNENPGPYIATVRQIMSKDNNFGQFVFREEQVEITKK